MKYGLIWILCLSFWSCEKKDAWLNKKPVLSDVVPVTLEDYQALLDNDYVLNNSYPALGLLGADNYWVTFENWQAAYTKQERNAYIWAPDIYEGEPGIDWNACYQVVSYANITLDGLKTIGQTAANRTQWNRLRGSALFYRAYAFYNLLQLFAPPYAAAAREQPGIPLRLDADLGTPSRRAALGESYDQVVTDLDEAITLLPAAVRYKTQPSKGAAAALLARVALIMGNWESAVTQATAALQETSALLDFNSLDAERPYPMPTFSEGNPEVLFYAVVSSFDINFPVGTQTVTDSVLYRSYAQGDLRKTLFYRITENSLPFFRGPYTGSYEYFSGLATNEVYLIRAEAQARLSHTAAALEDLNRLLQARWQAGSFVPLTAPDAPAALESIIRERQKELPFTGLRPWEDLRRLNQEPRFARTLTRTLNGQVYTLPPGDNRYMYLIPDIEIRLSGLEQNPR